MGLFNDRTSVDGKTGVPVWFMRQAGRYHDHYQNIKKNSDFITMCKTPDLACEVTMGPMDEFKFDAAILFSDILYPLEQLSMGLEYSPGPKMDFKLDSLAAFDKLKVNTPAREFYNFQKDALGLLRNKLATEKTLLGFVGAPFTLYSYAVEGSHSGNLTDSKKGLFDGRFDKFMEILLPELIENMKIQAQGGADAMCLFDTAVGELTLHDFKTYILPYVRKVTAEFKKLYPNKQVIYYSKLTHLDYLQSIEDDNIDVLGVDWRMSLPTALNTLGKDYYIQGNFDPSYLHLPWELVEKNLDRMWQELNSANVPMNKWICGLGHGVLQHTPKENVLNAVKHIHENFLY